MAATLAGVVAIHAVAGRILLPGLDRETVAASGQAARRLSIAALGIAPYVTILTLAELARLIVPALPRWEAASASNRRRMALIIAALALLLAAAQGLAIADASQASWMTGMSSANAGWQVAALVFGTAVTIGLTRMVRLPGLGGGF